MKKIATLAAAAVLAAGTASAATINFTSGGTGAAGATGLGTGSYAASADYTVLGVSIGNPTVTTSGAGLGVQSTFLDTNPWIDGTPLATAEILTITFSWAVNLVNFTLSGWDSNDDVEIAFNGGGFNDVYGPGIAGNPLTIAGANNVTSFSIRARGGAFDGFFGNDEFTLSGAEVASVPVPAAGLLLVGALGGLAALRRRKAIAA